MPRVDLAAARQRGAQLFNGFTSGQKTMLVLAGVGTVLGGMLFLRMSSSTDYAPLYSNLSPEAASDVTAALDSAGVDYEISDGGTIRVPRDEVYRTRIDLSAEGLPGDGDGGWDIFDDQGITTSEFRQQVDYQRAMEGELSRTIGSIDGVDGAIVHLVMPEDDLFSGDDQHPSASVLVETSPDRPLNGGQVQAVVHLVASAIEGLLPEHVTVADSTGRVLSASGQDNGIAAAGTERATQTAAFESAMSARIMEVLAPVTGPSGARVSVTARLDFDQREETSEEFGEPGTAPIVSETTSDETYDQTGSSATEPSPLPEGEPSTETGESSTYDRGTADRVFANDKITRTVREAPGDVERMSIAVVVDEARGYDMRALEQLVEANAAGAVDAEALTVEVTQLPFDTSMAEANADALAAADAAEARSQLFSLLRTVASVLIVAIVLFLAWRSHKKAVTGRYPIAIPLADAEDRALPAGERMDALDGELQALLAAPSEDDRERDALQGQITDLIDRQPDDVAQVLRSWMAER